MADGPLDRGSEFLESSVFKSARYTTSVWP